MTWNLDPVHSTVGFAVKHLAFSTVRGRFTGVTIKDIELDPSNLTAARGLVEVDVASVSTGEDGRDGHLRSGDFFDVESHPTLTFAVTGVDARGGDEYTVRGDLTIKGITKPIELTGEWAGADADPFGNKQRAGFSLSGEINRSEFGLTWNMPGQRLVVAEKVKLEIEIQVVEPAVEPAGASA